MLLCNNILNAQRQVKTINDGWRFIRQDIVGAMQTDFNDQEWETVNIPHSWNSDAYSVKEYYRGPVWYRKSILIPDTEKDQQIFIRWEGVNHSATIYINGKFIGEHKGGYTAFTFDITPYCYFGKENIIAVKADNTLNDVPPISGDFTIFGGMYRDVWLITTPKQHINLSDSGSDGIFIQTKDVSENFANYIIKGIVVNDTTTKASIYVTNTIKDKNGKLIHTTRQALSLKAHERKNFEHKGMISNPLLWSPESPDLYSVETIISDSKTGRILDIVNSYTGFRWFSFDGEKGFFLNGKPCKLNGVCRHQDQKPIANALSDEMHRRDMQMIKDMGANFIRISHYPQDPAIIEQCDKLGLLIWEEIPVIDIVPEAPSFGDNCESALREMIRQHHNHPSVIMWGYMNEILLVTQRRYNEEERKPVIKRSIELAERLEKVLKEEDSSRYSVMAFHGSESYNDLGFGNITDIVGWNLYQGWYSDDLEQFDKFVEKQQELFPGKPKIISEYGAGSDKRIHSLFPKRFDFSIQYQQEYAEHYLSVIEREPYICGSTYWNFIDFGSAQRDESMPRINNKGLVYSDRTPKDVYYLFQSCFRKDIPIIHIASRDWQNRSGLARNHEAVIQPVKVYSNLEKVELLMNGKSLGSKECKNYKAEWDIPFTTGTHFFTAKGIKNGKEIETGLTIQFTSIPEILDENTFSNNELAINVGSNTFYTSPLSNLIWIPDKEYTTGSWGYIGGEIISIQTEISNTQDNPLYQTLRISPEAYRFDVPPGQYEVELLFADIFQNKKDIPHTLGSESSNTNLNNKFDVYINDKIVDTNLDVHHSVGHYKAMSKKYIVEVKDANHISIRLTALSGKTFLNGIKLRKL